MADDVTLGEVQRGLREHRRESAEQHRALDERITRVAAESVPLDVYQSDQRATAELARRLERDRVEGERKLREDVIRPLMVRVDTLEKRPAMTVGRMAVIATAVIALAALVVQAWGTLKGAR